MDRPQVRTPDGFVLRRTGGYNIYEIALEHCWTLGVERRTVFGQH